jgi:hypothetical protein
LNVCYVTLSGRGGGGGSVTYIISAKHDSYIWGLLTKRELKGIERETEMMK